MTHWEAVEADFQRFYQEDLRTMGLRRIRSLLRGLPPESNIQRILHPQEAMWSPEVEWQVRAIEYADAFAWRICAVTFKAFTGKDLPVQEQMRIPRPGDPPPPKGVSRKAFMKLMGKGENRNVTVIPKGGETE